METNIRHLIDFEKVDILLEGFNKSTGFVTAILDLDGNVLSKSGWRTICTEFHRINPEASKRCTISDTVLANKMAEGEKYNFYKCLNGLIDVAVPIIVDGEHVANLFSGQFFFEKPNLAFFKQQAKKFGFDEKKYLDALSKVPIVSEEKVKIAMNFLLAMTLLISDLALEKAKQYELNNQIREGKVKAEESEAKLNALFTSMSEMVVLHELVFDENGKPVNYRIIDCNDAFTRITGIRRNASVGRLSTEVYGTKEPPFLKEYSEVALTGEPQQYETYFQPMDKYFSISVARPQKNHFATVTTDITEHKRVKEKVHEMDVLMKKLFENVPSMIYQFTRRPDGSYCVPIASKGIRNIFGCSPEDVRDNFEPISRVIYPEDAARVFEDIEYSAKHLSYFTCEFRVHIPGRDIQWIFSRSAPEKLSDGCVIWYGFNMDITERKRAEQVVQENSEKIAAQSEEIAVQNEELTETNKELIIANKKAKESEGKLKEAQLIAHMGSWELNIETNELFWSDEIFRIFDCEPQEFNATYESFLAFIHPDDREKVNCAYSNSIAAKTPYQIEHRIITKNKQIKYVREKCTTTYNKQGKPLNSIGIVIDITEQKALENDLLKAKEKAEESERLKTAFLANMSHEIRTPMNGILGFSDLLKEPDLTGDEQQKYIGIIEKSGERMLNIINDIIDISKIESGLMEHDTRETNVNEQIEFIYNFFQPEAQDKGINFSFKNPLPAKEAIIKTDREKLYAILTNLVKNALKYTEKGSIELGYHLKTDNEPGKLEFYVKDTGIGISKDRQEAIFERFIQADIADKQAHQGAGLGLSISKAYVEMLGGKIWVESNPDEKSGGKLPAGKAGGSTFYFTLPYTTEPTEVSIDRQHKPSVENKTIRKLKILIADDDKTSEMLIGTYIKSFAKEILKVRTGVEAVKICRTNPDIDLILMDIQMPEMGGYEATKQIREFNKEVIIIAQTAYGLAGDKEKALDAGCNDYISKPIKKEVLLHKIGKLKFK
ncbi:MAG: PocR ligand-binding domain-containing protein [Bacteroidetes bacterium]|jgi:PAS domain S-box-containing protein|nr:PocR ligand-binding domain-containing protein [Bacteroidota bacterium]